MGSVDVLHALVSLALAILAAAGREQIVHASTETLRWREWGMGVEDREGKVGRKRGAGGEMSVFAASDSTPVTRRPPTITWRAGH